VFSKKLLNELHHGNSALFALLLLNISRELARRLQFTDDMLLKAVHGQDKAARHSAKISG
jgi:hypothetical protein